MQSQIALRKMFNVRSYNTMFYNTEWVNKFVEGQAKYDKEKIQ